MRKRQSSILSLVFCFVLLSVSLVFASGTEIELLNQEIQNQGARWVAGETSLSVLSQEEMQQRLGLHPVSVQLSGEKLKAVAAPLAVLPASLNYADQGFVSPAKDQLYCGSCWAFASTAVLESKVAMATNVLPDLAEQILISCSGAGDCNGGYLDQVSDFIRDVGVPLEYYLPYISSSPVDHCSKARADWQNATYGITGWHLVTKDSPTESDFAPTEDDLKRALVAYGPLIASMEIYDDLRTYIGWSVNPPGVYSHVAGQYLGSHAVELVGYDDSLQCFIAKSSWGTKWGEKGFFRIAYTELRSPVQFGLYTIAYEGYDGPTEFGALKVTISPQGAIDAGALWRVDGGPWQRSGATLKDIPAGQHTLEYRGVTNWSRPPNQKVTISNGQISMVDATYTYQTGTLKVYISPPKAVAAGAKWRVDGGAWQTSETEVPGLRVGKHLVEFTDVPNYTKPAPQYVTIYRDQTVCMYPTYATGSIMAYLYPPAAVKSGAQWRVDGGPWQDNLAEYSGLAAGIHTVQFKEIPGFTKPLDQTVSVQVSTTHTTVNGTYTPTTGSVTVYIDPWEAVQSGAQWRVDGGAWQNSHSEVPGLVPGPHTVEFKDIPNWEKPANQTVTTESGGKNTSTSALYTRKNGSLTVNILPQEAIDAGAKWWVAGISGSYNSGATVSLPFGEHTIFFYLPFVPYQFAPRWVTPLNQYVNISVGQTTTVTGIFKERGSLKVAIEPQEAVAAGAFWRVKGDSTWRASNETISWLQAGPFVIEYKDLAGWAKPANRTVTIEDEKTTMAVGTYVKGTPLTVTISPQVSPISNMKWRVDGGDWYPSGATIYSAAGQHTLEFEPSYGWKAPATRVITIYDGQPATASGTYIETGTIKVNISPQEAVSAGAQWRRVGGAWQPSGKYILGLVPGQHVVEFNEIPGWIKPANQTITIEAGKITTGIGTYTKTNTLINVTITPEEAVSAGAQWRIDGGAWQNSGTAPLPGDGQHLLEFKPIANWKTPASQTITISNGQSTAAIGTYIQTGTIKVVITPPEAVSAGAQWRRVGGAWQVSGKSIAGLVPGPQNVEFKDVPGWTKPANQTVIIEAGKISTGVGTYSNQAP